MPELPEVEIMTRNASRWLLGQTLDRVVADDPDVVSTGMELIEKLAGLGVDRVWRRAKHLLLDVGSYGLAVHFRMTGKLVRLPTDGRIRLSLHAGPETIGFKDARRLGSVRISTIEARDAWLEDLGMGPDVFPEIRSGEWWQERFSGTRRALKPALLDQGRVAGIGNILASEICHRARISPFTRVSDLSLAQWDGLAEATPTVIAEVIEAEEADEIRFVGERDAHELTTFRVYGRATAPCDVCGAPISSARQAQRSTFWCDRCQPPPG